SATPSSHTYTLSLHDALPIFLLASDGEPLVESADREEGIPTDHHCARDEGDQRVSRLTLTRFQGRGGHSLAGRVVALIGADQDRSEEHTSELQSQSNLVCRLL